MNDIVILNLEGAFRGKGWQGPTLSGSLRGVTAKEAATPPGKGRKTIWDHTLHAAYWKYVVRRRLTGEKRGSFPLAGSNWFKRPGLATPAAWKADLALLDQEHKAMRKVVAGLSSASFGRRAPDGKTTIGHLVRGIAAHDLYHAGQIQALKRLCPY